MTLKQILEEVWNDGSDSKYAMGNRKQSITHAQSEIIKCVPKEMPIPGAVIPVNNIDNQEEVKGYWNGWNDCREEMIKRLGQTKEE